MRTEKKKLKKKGGVGEKRRKFWTPLNKLKIREFFFGAKFFRIVYSCSTSKSFIFYSHRGYIKMIIIINRINER